MNKVHYYVLIHKKNEEAGDVLGFFKSREDAEQAKSNYAFPLHEMQIIETDSNLKKI